ncbi:MAG: class I SAM-dependent methyltransferase [Sulfolobales archaeon]
MDKISSLIGCSTSEVKRVLKEKDLMEISEHVTYKIGVYKTLILGPSSRPRKAEILYAIVRLTKPYLVVETGVQCGISSAFILKALEKNGGEGMLYSIDLPDENILKTIPPDNRGYQESGWLVPRELRYKWKLILGRSQEKLVPLLEQLGEIDIFIHDSEHSYENIMWEYTIAWTYLKPGGILLSDDVNLNNAFYDFAKKEKMRPIIILHSVGGLRRYIC